ncbi:hypothetical protein PROFUN_03488 [Planoprotostelium fungivorum]|uniref:Uncharacterized protein n=1 Tax=Planoprotostelium fungivorum TaxID=1890364 RepID=A0A2P6MN81_9EUKA|nr:hypothetical protein PROFUN_03488 [Planoprotostelium fungivorum]
MGVWGIVATSGITTFLGLMAVVCILWPLYYNTFEYQEWMEGDCILDRYVIQTSLLDTYTLQYRVVFRVNISSSESPYTSTNYSLSAIRPRYGDSDWIFWESTEADAVTRAKGLLAGFPITCWIPPLALNFPPGGDAGLIYLDTETSPQMSVVNSTKWYTVGIFLAITALCFGIATGYLTYKLDTKRRRKWKREQEKNPTRNHWKELDE